jgi:hypothetical protein
MSFIITIYVREGIVMASDSRLSLNNTSVEGDKNIINVSVAQSDANYKTFIAPGNIGISTYGRADIGGIPIAGFIETFIQAELQDKNITVDQIPDKLLTYFNKIKPPPSTWFHVAGYMLNGKVYEQRVWVVDVEKKTVINNCKPGEQGASWGGEADILSRLIMPVAELDDKGQIKNKLPHFEIPWQFFTLQDAIDFAVFAIRSTIEAIRFQLRAKTVGGPIDVLIIKPDKVDWVQRKELSVR